MNIWIYNNSPGTVLATTTESTQFTCFNSSVKGGDLIITYVYYSEVENGFLGKVYEVDYVEYNVEGLDFHVVHVLKKDNAGFQGELY